MRMNPDQERVLTSIKSNLGASMPSLRYQGFTATLQGMEVAEEGIAHLKNVPVVEWLGECGLDAATLLAAAPTGRRAAGANSANVEAAMAWLSEALADGPHPKTEVRGRGRGSRNHPSENPS